MAMFTDVTTEEKNLLLRHLRLDHTALARWMNRVEGLAGKVIRAIHDAHHFMPRRSHLSHDLVDDAHLAISHGSLTKSQDAILTPDELVRQSWWVRVLIHLANHETAPSHDADDWIVRGRRSS
jgi:hypothetical protein